MSITNHSLVKYLILYTVSISFIRLAPAAFASRSLSITANKSILTGDEELTLTASPSGFTAGETIYIKGAFYKEGSTNYFGYTKKDTNWIKNNATTTDQRSIIIGSWDNTAIVKPDYNDSGFQGNGNYLLKLGYYYITGGGNLSSVQWPTNNLVISLTQPTPTPSPSPTTTPSPSSTPTLIPTSTPFPTSNPTPTSNSPTSKSSPQVLAEADENYDSQPEVNLDIIDLTATAESEINPSPTTQPEKSNSNLPIIIISAAGIILMLGGGLPLIWSEFKSRKKIK